MICPELSSNFEPSAKSCENSWIVSIVDVQHFRSPFDPRIRLLPHRSNTLIDWLLLDALLSLHIASVIVIILSNFLGLERLLCAWLLDLGRSLLATLLITTLPLLGSGRSGLALGGSTVRYRPTELLELVLLLLTELADALTDSVPVGLSYGAVSAVLWAKGVRITKCEGTSGGALTGEGSGNLLVIISAESCAAHRHEEELRSLSVSTIRRAAREHTVRSFSGVHFHGCQVLVKYDREAIVKHTPLSGPASVPPVTFFLGGIVVSWGVDVGEDTPKYLCSLRSPK